MARLHLAPFDRDRDFITLRAFLCRGTNYSRAVPFDKQTVTTRTLRILYEGRSIGYVEDWPSLTAERPAPMSDAERAELLDRPRPALVQMASGLGINTPPKATKNQIVAKIARSRDVAAFA